MHLADEFKNTRIPRAGDGSEGGATEAPIRIIQRRRIRDIECLRSNLETPALGNSKRLADHQVGRLEARPPNWITRTVPDHELCCRRERCSIEVPGNAPPREVVGIVSPIRPLDGEAQTG